MRIFESLDSHLISFLDADTRDEAIDSLIALLAKAGKLPDKALFRNAIFHREKLVSTGIGMGVAVPHAKMKNFPNFFIAIGIQKKKGLDWNALDTAPVRIIFMIGGPEDKQSEYLQILSQLTSAIKNVDLRKSLLKSQSPEQVLRLFSDF
jgi:PTS system nitrogen regulatory IIA component